MHFNEKISKEEYEDVNNNVNIIIKEFLMLIHICMQNICTVLQQAVILSTKDSGEVTSLTLREIQDQDQEQAVYYL